MSARQRRTLAAALAAVLTLASACSQGSGSSMPSGTAGTTVPGGTGQAVPTQPGPAASGETTGATQDAGSTGAPSGTGGTGAAGSGADAVPEQILSSDHDVLWSLASLPDGSHLFTERESGTVFYLAAGEDGADPTATPTEAGTIPGVYAEEGEGGLLGIAVPVDFEVNPVIYVYYTTREDNRVAAVPWTGDGLGEPQVVLSGIPRAVNHNGGRIAFGPDGWLYVATGDAQAGTQAQDTGSLAGKILRITPEGQPAPGNPFGGSPIWSYGHRNVQGLAWDSEKRLWATEFGADAWDELNLIKPGLNYGWPMVEGESDGSRDDLVDPVKVWTPAEMSPSGLAIGPDGAAYIAALRGESIWRVPLNADGTAGTAERFLEGTYGRLRDIAFVGQRVWLLTSNNGDDRIISVPQSAVGVS